MYSLTMVRINLFVNILAMSAMCVIPPIRENPELTRIDMFYGCMVFSINALFAITNTARIFNEQN